MKKKILLINPRNIAYTLAEGKIIPLGLAYIAGILVKYGHIVKCIDLQVESENKLDIEIHNCDIVGISTLTPNIKEAWRIAKKAKENNKLVIIGGPHPSVLPDESLSTGYIDIVCRGESEYTIVDIVNGNIPLGQIKGISYIENGFIKHNPDREYISNLDEIPFPLRTSFPLDKYRLFLHKGKNVMTILTSRGCPNNCNFCYKGISGRVYRMRSVNNILQEWEQILKLGADEIGIVDDSFTVNRTRVIEFCDALIKEKMNIYMEGSSRVDTVDKDMLIKMRQAGYWRIAFGIESGSQKILDIIGKNITLNDIIKSITWAKESGMKVTGFFMIGNYGEDKNTINETIEFAKKLPLDYIQFTIAVPYPGTHLYNMIKENGRFLFKEWSELGSYSGRAYFEQGNVTKELVEKMFRKAYRSCYLTPKMILKKLIEFKPDMLRFVRLLR